MKTIYIPKGETIRYESLATEHLVVHGCLQVTCGITAKTITGYGTVHAGTVNADVIRVDDMDAGSIVCKRLLAKRVQSPEVFASESAAVSCFLSSAYVETGKLTVTEQEKVRIQAIIRKRQYGITLSQMKQFFKKHQHAREIGDKKTMEKIEYYLTDINFHYECGLLISGQYDKLSEVIKNW